MKNSILNLTLIALLIFIAFSCTKNPNVIPSATIVTTWQKISAFESINCMVANGNNLYAGNSVGGLYLSNDDGISWNIINNGLSTTKIFSSLVISGSNIAVGSRLSGGLYISTNSGNNWVYNTKGLPYQILNTNDTTYLSITSIAINGNNIFASGYGLYSSNNFGNNWILDTTGFPHNSDTSYLIGATSLNVSGGNIFTTIDGHGVYISNNNGNSWSAMNSGLPTINAGTYYLASNSSNIFAAGNSGIYEANNTGSSWSQIINGFGTTTIETIVTKGDTIFLGTNNGINIFINNGNNWSALNTGFSSGTIVNCIGLSNNYVYIGTEGIQYYYTEEGEKEPEIVGTGVYRQLLSKL